MEKFEWVARTEARFPLQNSPSPTYPRLHSHVTSRKAKGNDSHCSNAKINNVKSLIYAICFRSTSDSVAVSIIRSVYIRILVLDYTHMILTTFDRWKADRITNFFSINPSSNTQVHSHLIGKYDGTVMLSKVESRMFLIQYNNENILMNCMDLLTRLQQLIRFLCKKKKSFQVKEECTFSLRN